MVETITNSQNYIQEDEIDLKELFFTIMRYKYKIALFSFTVTILTLFFVLSKPNLYKSEVILSPQEQAKSSLGDLSALAGLAGVDLDGGGGMDTFTYLNTILKDYNFNEMVIKKYSIDKKLNNPKIKDNFVFALGFRGAYDFLHSIKESKVDKKSKDDVVFDTYETIKSIINLSSDKKSGALTMSVEHSDRFLAKELLEIYLKELTTYLRKLDMLDVEKKLQYYESELVNTQDVELKTQLSQIMSSLVQKKVLSKASEFYIVKKITEPRVANIKEKTKPKRALILIVSLVTSLILGIFGAFFIEFIRGDD